MDGSGEVFVSAGEEGGCVHVCLLVGVGVGVGG